MIAVRPAFIQPASVVAILAATIPGAVQGAVTLSGLQAALFVGAVLVAMVFAIPCLAWAERHGGERSLQLVLAGYFAAIAVALWLSRGHSFLIAMPLASFLVLYLPLRRALPLTLLLFGWCIAVLADGFSKSAAAFSFGAAFSFVVVFSLIARRERFARLEIERLSAQLETLAASRERNRIAREIHDSVGHYLTVANVQLEAARATEVDRDARLVRVQELLREGLSELRHSVSMLRETLPASQPFSSALEQLVADSSATLHIVGERRLLSGAVGFTLYRAAQEGLTNAQKHANAKQLNVVVDYQPTAVRLEVRDDGRSAPKEFVVGNGLRGVRERVESLGGTVTHGTSPHGFTLAVEVPT